MFKNYLKIAYRNLIKHKSFSLINIFGLSLGITCCILILAYIGYEFSYDRYHKNAESIYRIASKRTTMGRTQEFAVSPGPAGPTMIKDFPEVINAVRFMPTVKRAFAYGDKKFFETGVLYADQSVFKVFSFELIEGDPETALEVPFTMVITQETAQKYFGDESPMGKIIKWDNNFEYRITGVVKSPPPNSHFTFNVLASFSTLIRYDPRLGSSWNTSYQTYLLLQENTDPEEFEKKIGGFIEKYLGPMLKERGIEQETYLQPLKSIHLHSRLMGELGVNSDIKIIYTFSAIALVILLIACINFMNLSTARSAIRTKEIGLRKVLGAERSKLVLQFLGESFIFAMISLVAAILMAQLLLPYFRNLADRDISIDYLQMPYFTAGLVGIVLFVGLVAGSYPAFFLSAFKPIAALRGNIQHSLKRSWFRSILVVFQFAITTVLTICTVIIFSQQKHMKNKDLGFNKKNLLIIAIQNKEVRSILESFKSELLKIKGVSSSGASSMVPGEMYLFNSGIYPEGFPRDQQFRMDNFLVDQDFIETFEIEIVKGRGFSKDIATDIPDSVMINETAVRKLGWDNPVGKTIEIVRSGDDPIKKTVIGVFRDIHQRSLYAVVEPTFIQYVSDEGPIENRARRLAVRLDTDDLPRTMREIEQKWKEVYPDHPYYSFFLDDFFDSQHRAEEKLGNIFRAFSVLAVLIGCVGLFGLASYMAEKRTKEIGIRKVLGSTVDSIVVLLCREFLLLIAIANGIAWPIAFVAMKKWLQNFPYPTSIQLSTFILTALLTLIIASFTVSYQSVKAASANPVESLRFE
ncbi:MAG: ABC transporter permease [Candidatus Aminicenantes bacterium]|nr:MAG: ABC transporter permease [Candidatus Aminicenantes bacterium]